MTEWSEKKLKTQEAIIRADVYMEKIREIGRVDEESAVDKLLARGLDHGRRKELYTMYKKLKKRCGQRVPFDDPSESQGSKWCC